MSEQKSLTVVQVSRRYDVSARMLRHYEKMGLITSSRVADYAYRVYDAQAVERIRTILLLRKLRISLKDIAVILQDPTHVQMLETLRRSVAEMDDQIASLTLIRNVLSRIADKCSVELFSYRLMEDEEVLRSISTLPAPAKQQVQEVVSMSDVNNASKILEGQLVVRVVMLPPYTVASFRFVGENPEEAVGDMTSRFVQQSHLYERKPDARMFGFNSPNPGVMENGLYGYENWVTIPENFELPQGAERKHMTGGLYAVLAIKFPEFQRWQELVRWVDSSPDYEPGGHTGPENMFGGLEEHINWVYAASQGWPEDGVDGQIDLMMPIRKRRRDNK